MNPVPAERLQRGGCHRAMLFNILFPGLRFAHPGLSDSCRPYRACLSINPGLFGRLDLCFFLRVKLVDSTFCICLSGVFVHNCGTNRRRTEKIRSLNMSFDEKTVWTIQKKTQFNTDNIEKVLRLLEMFECKKLSQQAKVIYLHCV